MNTKIATFVLLITSTIVLSQNRYIDTVFESVSKKTYNYSVKGKDTLKLDFYEPENDSLNKRPLFVIVHGGGFNSGKRNSRSLITLAESIAKKGFVVASIDYRLIGNNKSFNCSTPVSKKLKVYSNGAYDLLSALEYLIKYKSNFKIDESKIILAGISAGAESVLNVTYNRELVIKNTKRYLNIKPAAIISVSGALLNADLILKKNAVPGIFYHGVDDSVIPYNKGAHQSCKLKNKGFLIIDGSNRITEKLEEYNSSFLLYSYLNQGHYNFDLPNDDIRQAFLFINKVVFENKPYQARITQ
jgi:poly(3-hydroxybutyrate) depolymerase